MENLEKMRELNADEMNAVSGGCGIDEYEEPVQDEDEKFERSQDTRPAKIGRT